jgi:glycosyl transferase, family 25
MRKVLVINLDRASERLAHMKSELAAIYLPFDRVVARDGMEFSDLEIKDCYSPFWFGLFHGRQITKGELGCALSHRSAYRKIIDEKLDWALILEDDVSVEKFDIALLGRFIDAAPAADVIQLYYSEHRPHKTKPVAHMANFEIIKVKGTHASAVGYIVKKSGAVKLLKYKKVFLTADKFSWMEAILGVKFVAVTPFLVKPHAALNGESDIDRTNENLQTTRKVRSKPLLWRLLARPMLIFGRKVMVAGRNAL